MRRKFLAGFLSLCLALSLLPMSALAVGEEDNAPTITNLSIAGVSAVADRNNLYVPLAVGTDLSGKAFTMTTSEAVSFQAATSGALGEMYVSSVATDGTVTLTLAVGVESDYDYSITMSSDNGVTWTGTFSSNFGMTAGTLADAASSANLTLKAGSMVNASNVGNAAVQVLGNRDMNNAYLVFCAPGQTVNTVNYVVNDTTNVWKLPNGAVLPQPTFTTEAPEGWYYDEDYSQPVTFGNDTTVTGNMTLHAKTTATEPATFLSKLQKGENVTITTMDEWNTFVQHSGDVKTGQLITLGLDVNCNNATYSALTFKGNFNGDNHTISNASFNAVDGNSGLFAVIGPGQKVCNLILDNVSAKTASTYAGVLAGQIAGTEGNRALVQNVQVKNSSAVGRSAAGIAGFVFFADVKYCSSRNTTITGAANGGGIAGISYGLISNCYSTCTPTALLSSGRGGIAGKNLEGGRIEVCWCKYAAVRGTSTGATEVNVVPNVTENHYADDFDSNVFSSTYWELCDGLDTQFTDAVKYQF